MDLDRGTLAKIDRSVLSGLDHDDVYRMVRVPVSAATWSAWMRYCRAMGVSMGRAIVALVEHELLAVAGETIEGGPVFANRAREQLAEQEANLAARKLGLDDREEQIRQREQQLRVKDQQIRTAPSQLKRPSQPRVKVGRNERCPCGSGLKYKHCHGLVGHRT